MGKNHKKRDVRAFATRAKKWESEKARSDIKECFTDAVGMYTNILWVSLCKRDWRWI